MDSNQKVQGSPNKKVSKGEGTSDTSLSKVLQVDKEKQGFLPTSKSELTTPLLPGKNQSNQNHPGKPRKLSETTDMRMNSTQKPGLKRGLTNPNIKSNRRESIQDEDEMTEYDGIAMKTLRNPGVDKTNILDSLALCHFDDADNQQHVEQIDT